jgi:pilus assembly protein CpaE
MSAEASSIRYAAEASDRPQAMIYTRDPDCEGVLRQCLRDLPRNAVAFRSEGLRSAAAEVAERGSPRLLVVDITSESEAVDQVRELCGRCEPSTQLVVIGQENDIRLYRALLDAGVSEYFFKPLVAAMVSRSLRKLLLGEQVSTASARVGQVVYVAGVRGGCGATTLSVALGAMLSVSPPRPVLLLDLDVQRGDAALALDQAPNPALREALTHASRVDDLLLERGLIQVTKRLDLLASLEPLDNPTTLDQAAVMALLGRVTRRYRYVIVEVPAHAAANLERALHMPSTLVLVSDARLASAREIARWRSWIADGASERTVVHVLNMLGAPGSLPLAEFTKAAGRDPDVVIPYSKEIAEHTLTGAAAEPSGALAKGVQPLAAMFGLEATQSKRPFLKRIFG